MIAVFLSIALFPVLSVDAYTIVSVAPTKYAPGVDLLLFVIVADYPIAGTNQMLVHLLLSYDIQYLITDNHRFICTYIILKLQHIILNVTPNISSIIMTHLIIHTSLISVNKY